MTSRSVARRAKRKERAREWLFGTLDDDDDDDDGADDPLDGPQLRVMCNREPHHVRKGPSLVVTFVLVAPGHEHVPPGWQLYYRSFDRKSLPPAEVRGEALSSPRGADGQTLRYRLECPLCRYTVPIRREVLAPALDWFHDADRSSISLQDLTGVISRQRA